MTTNKKKPSKVANTYQGKRQDEQLAYLRGYKNKFPFEDPTALAAALIDIGLGAFFHDTAASHEPSPEYSPAEQDLIRVALERLLAQVAQRDVHQYLPALCDMALWALRPRIIQAFGPGLVDTEQGKP